MNTRSSIFFGRLKFVLQLLGLFLLVLLSESNFAKAQIKDPYQHAMERYRKNQKNDSLPEKIGYGTVPTTPPRTPQEEKKGFHLPPGFKVTLFASEPDIGRPINMAFDGRGRLWVTQSAQYPYPDNQGFKSRVDRIFVLEDTDGDGHADIIKDFADSLSIPMAIVPTVDGGAIAYNIPSIYKFYDTNGDSHADHKKILYKGFGHVDTHGMINHFKRGFDGWIYGVHGFANTSVVRTADNDSLAYMHSSATYRFKPDGKHFEVLTRGQVNLFGLTFDKWGNMYVSDSHSLPIWQKIPGGDYPNFSHNPASEITGIGFAPVSMHRIFKENKPTARAGLVLYTGHQFPKKYRNSFFQSNVLTHKIFRDTLIWGGIEPPLHEVAGGTGYLDKRKYDGATPVIKYAETFMSSDDPYFHVVDIVVGPDGALYLADWYNRIIGDYEIPHDDPRRDHHLGRIWKITYEGNKKHSEGAKPIDWSTASINTLVKGLGNPVLQVRFQVENQLVNRIGMQAIPAVRAMVSNDKTLPIPKVHGLWVLYQMNALPDALIIKATQDSSALVRSHVMRILGEMPKLNVKQEGMLIAGLKDKNAHVRRSAVQALAKHPGMKSFGPVLKFLQKIPGQDPYMQYAARLCLRNHLQKKSIREKVVTKSWNIKDLRTILDVIGGVSSVNSGKFSIRILK